MFLAVAGPVTAAEGEISTIAVILLFRLDLWFFLASVCDYVVG